MLGMLLCRVFTASILLSVTSLYHGVSAVGEGKIMSAPGFRDPLIPGCWACGGNPGWTKGQYQYGIANADSQQRTGKKTHPLGEMVPSPGNP